MVGLVKMSYSNSVVDTRMCTCTCTMYMYMYIVHVQFAVHIHVHCIRVCVWLRSLL